MMPRSRRNTGATAGQAGCHALVLTAAGQALGIGDATVARAWRRYGVKPWRRETFKFSTDPELEAKVRDVVGLYLNTPEKAVVLCVDEESQIQALNRTAPILPLRQSLAGQTPADHIALHHAQRLLAKPGRVFFGIITRQAIRRGSFDSVRQLVGATRTFLDGWNNRCHPFIWTKIADEILPHATRQTSSDARH